MDLSSFTVSITTNPKTGDPMFKKYASEKEGIIIIGFIVVIAVVGLIVPIAWSISDNADKGSAKDDKKYSAATAGAPPQACKKNSDCKYNVSATYCNQSTGTCTCGKNIDQCSGDTPYCGDSVKVSDQGECIQCRDWADCPPGKICNGNYQCVPDGPVTSCTTNANCGYGWYCDMASGGSCEQECRTTADCDTLAGQYCEQSTGRCIGGKNCASDGDCANGYQCDPASKTCTKKNDCTLAPYACPTGFHCNTRTMSCDKDECTVNSDCDDGYMCTNAKCTGISGYCDADHECPPGQSCSKDGTCVKSTPMCPEACPVGQECIDGACAPAGCQSSADCARVGGYCINEKCGPCIRDDFNTGCPNGEVCGADGYCTIDTPPPECMDDSNCAVGQKCDAGKCADVSCKKDSDCSHGGRCYDKKCGPCTSSDQCHSDEQCINGACTKVVVQSNCKPPCSPGFECVGSSCVPHSCTQDSDCSSVGGYCLGNGSCGKCTSQADCQDWDVCDTKKGACVPASGSGGSGMSGGTIAGIVIGLVIFAAAVGFGVYKAYMHFEDNSSKELVITGETNPGQRQIEKQIPGAFTDLKYPDTVIEKLSDKNYVVFKSTDFPNDKIDQDTWKSMKDYYDSNCKRFTFIEDLRHCMDQHKPSTNG